MFLHLRSFYAHEETQTSAFIILSITAVKVILPFFAPRLASDDKIVAVLLGATNGFGSVADVVIDFLLLRRTLGHLDSKAIVHTALRALGAPLIGVAATQDAFALTDLTLFGFLGSLGALPQTIVTGVVFLIGTGLVLAQAPLEGARVLGGFLGRISGLHHSIPQSHAANNAATNREDMKRERGFAADAFSVAPSNLVGEATGLANGGSTASPLLLPMSTRDFRPTRYVLGEMVLGGRFRLRSEVTAYPGLRLQRAMDMDDPDNSGVALVFADTVTLSYYDTSPSVAVQKIAAATNELRDPTGIGMSRIYSAAKTCTEVLIVADWTSSIGVERFDQAAHPNALVLAVVSFAETIADAHESGRCLDLTDEPGQLRINNDGHIYDVFSVVLPDSSRRSDYNASFPVVGELFYNVPDIPSDISVAIDHAKQICPEDFSQQESPACVSAGDSRAAAFDPDSSEFLAINPDIGARESVDADGAAQLNARHIRNCTRTLSTGTVAVDVVIVGALVAAGIFGLVNRSSGTPINSESV